MATKIQGVSIWPFSNEVEWLEILTGPRSISIATGKKLDQRSGMEQR